MIVNCLRISFAFLQFLNNTTDELDCVWFAMIDFLRKSRYIVVKYAIVEVFGGY